MSPNDALTFSVAERRLDGRIDQIEDRLSNLKVEAKVRVDWEIELPEPSNRGTILGVMALALSVVALCVAVFG